MELRPPVFQEVKEWANVPENDPQFQSLPQWKKALILRRREDIAKRSGQGTGNVPKPAAEQQSEGPALPGRAKAVATLGQPASGDKSGSSSNPSVVNKRAGDQAGNDKAKPWAGGDSGKINTPLGQTSDNDKTKPGRSPGVNDRTKPGPNLNQSEETNSNKLTGASSSNQSVEVTPRASTHNVTPTTQSSGVKTLQGRFGPKDQTKDTAAPNTTPTQLTPSSGKSKSPTGSTIFFPTPQTKATTPEPSKAGGLKPPLFSPPPDQLSPMRPSSSKTSEPPPSPVGSLARPTSPDAEDQESDGSCDELEVTNIDDVLGEEVREEVGEEVDGGGCSAPIVIQPIQSDAFLPQGSAPIPLASVKTNGLDKAPVSSSVGKIPSTFSPLSPPTSPLQKNPPTWSVQKTPPTSPTSPISPTGGAVKSILIAGEPLPKKKSKVRLGNAGMGIGVEHNTWTW